MFEWKVEDMKLLNQKGGLYYGKEKIYNCEHEVSREDKIAFVDSLQDGNLTYLLGLIEKFNDEKMGLPKDNWGGIKTVSLKAWIKRNDTKTRLGIIDRDYQYGKYKLLGTGRYITSNQRGAYDTYEDLVDEMFHRQLRECEKKERKYFLEHDEYSILKQKFREKNHCTTFGVKIADCSDGKMYVYDNDDDYNRREITIDELKDLLSKYEQLDALVEKLTAETYITY